MQHIPAKDWTALIFKVISGKMLDFVIVKRYKLLVQQYSNRPGRGGYSNILTTGGFGEKYFHKGRCRTQNIPIWVDSGQKTINDYNDCYEKSVYKKCEGENLKTG